MRMRLLRTTIWNFLCLTRFLVGDPLSPVHTDSPQNLTIHSVTIWSSAAEQLVLIPSPWSYDYCSYPHITWYMSVWQTSTLTTSKALHFTYSTHLSPPTLLFWPPYTVALLSWGGGTGVDVEAWGLQQSAGASNPGPLFQPKFHCHQGVLPGPCHTQPSSAIAPSFRCSYHPPFHLTCWPAP